MVGLALIGSRMQHARSVFVATICCGRRTLPPSRSWSWIVLRRALSCHRKNYDDIDRPSCVANKCSQCQDMKLLSKLACPAALERARKIDLTWEEIKDVEKGVD
eukprot:3382315-Pleurochrysis_carterae.AAC.1